VSDTGTGITSDSVDAVFEPFVTSKENGLGLGLPICTSNVDAHGGRLWASNNDGPGATFHMVLPQVSPGSESDSMSRSGESLAASPVPNRV
jgi:signal transduction histidine kinase